MTDIWTPEKRSEVMARIHGNNTGPERKVRSLLHSLGYRFTVGGPKNKSLPGKPDIVLPKYRTVILVHGCFWHGHDHCPDFRLPASRVAWWTAKIAGNKARDARVQAALLALGWHVVTIWACAVKNKTAEAWLTARLPALLGVMPGSRARRVSYAHPDQPSDLPMVAEENTKPFGHFKNQQSKTVTRKSGRNPP